VAPTVRQLVPVLDVANLSGAMAKVLLHGGPAATLTAEESLEVVATLIKAGEVQAAKAHGHSVVAVIGNTGEAIHPRACVGLGGGGGSRHAGPSRARLVLIRPPTLHQARARAPS